MGHEDSHELYIRNDLFIRRLNTVLPDLLSDTSPSTLTRVELLDVNEYKEEPLKKDDMYGLKAFDIDRKLISWIRHFSLPPESFDEYKRSKTVVGLKRHGIVVDWTGVTTK